MAKQVAVISGAAQGIGFLVAKKLSETHRVALIDVEGDEVRRAAAECGPDAVFAECNIIEQDQVETAVAKIVEQTGGIDVVMSGAGIGVGGALRHTHPDVVASMMNVNVTGNWRLIHACLPHVIERKGYVMAISSGAAIAPTTALGGYCASKAGIEMLMEVLRLELEHLGVDVGIAYFLFHDTQMVRLGREFIPAFDRSLSEMPGPMHGIYEPQQAADAIVKAIMGRDHKAFSPGYLGEVSATRMTLRTGIGSMLPEKHAHEIDELTAQNVAERGSFQGAMVPSLAAKVAAQSVGRDIELPEKGFDPSPAPG